MICDYCSRPATERIPAVHGDTCLAHTIEFWQGFMAYAKKHPAPPAVKAAVTVPASPLPASQTN